MSWLKNVRNRQSDSLAKISWQDFESLLARYYESLGYRVDHVGTANTNQKFDGGIDLKLFKDSEYILVQCKHWNAKQVPHNDVHQLIGLRVNESATGAVLVSSGEFTQAAKVAAGKGGVKLIDGEQLRGMLGDLMPQIVEDSSYRDLIPSAVSTSAKDMFRKGTNVVLNEADKRVTKHINHVGSRAADILIWKLLLPIFLFITFIVILLWALNMIGKSISAPQHAEPSNSAVSHPPSIKSVTLPAPDMQLRLTPIQIPVPRNSLSRQAPIAEIGSADEFMTKEELRDWEKKNSEAMKTLEENTPEL